MRHRKTLKTMGRTSAHRKATLANLTKTTDVFPSAVDEAVALMKDAQVTMEEFRRLLRGAQGADIVQMLREDRER